MAEQVEDPNQVLDGQGEEHQQSHEAVHVDPSTLKAPRVYVGNLAFSVGWQDLKDFFRERVGEVSRVEIISYPSGRSKGCAIVEFASNEDAARAINECGNEDIQGRKIFLREDREEKGFSTARQPFPGQFPPYGGRGGGMMGGGGGGYQRGPSIYNQGQGQGGRGGGFAPRGGRGGYAGGYGGQGGADQYQRGPPQPTGTNDGTAVYVGNLPWRTSWQELKDMGAQFGDVHRADVAQDRFTGRSKGFGTLRFASPEAAQAAIEALNESDLQGRKIVARLDQFA